MIDNPISSDFCLYDRSSELRVTSVHDSLTIGGVGRKLYQKALIS